MTSSVAPVSSLTKRTLLQVRSEEHTSELQSRQYLVCRLLLEQKQTHASSPDRLRDCSRARAQPLRACGHRRPSVPSSHTFSRLSSIYSTVSLAVFYYTMQTIL